MLAFDIFSESNRPRVYLFSSHSVEADAKRYGTKGYVRLGRVQINCIGSVEIDGMEQGVVNVNVIDEDILWIEDISYYIRLRLDNLLLDGYHFSFLTELNLKWSRNLDFVNIRYRATKSK